MTERAKQEIELLKKRYPNLEVSEDDNWVLIPDYSLLEGVGWNKETMNVCFQIPAGYPGPAPYGIYVPSDLQNSYGPIERFQQPAANKPPFPGDWGILSWSPEEWKPSADIIKGSNLLNFVQSFADRFKGGK